MSSKSETIEAFCMNWTFVT